MAIVTHQSPLKGGVNLVRHYPAGSDPDIMCGAVSYYQQIEEQLTYQAIGYYTPKDAAGYVAGPNKFLRHVVWHIYAPGTPMPPDIPGAEAWCHPPNAAGEIYIRLRYYAPASAHGPVKGPSALSHEMGHAWHFWAGLYAGQAALTDVEKAWEMMAASNRTRYNPSAAPWQQPDRLETPREQFANAYRYLFGALATRGSSGNSVDPVLPGFEDPAAHPEWRKILQMLPETCAFIRAHGLRAGSLTWMGGEAGYWQFQRADGVWVAQTDYYGWHAWNGSAWTAYRPSYTLI